MYGIEATGRKPETAPYVEEAYWRFGISGAVLYVWSEDRSTGATYTCGPIFGGENVNEVHVDAETLLFFGDDDDGGMMSQSVFENTIIRRNRRIGSVRNSGLCLNDAMPYLV